MREELTEEFRRRIADTTPTLGRDPTRYPLEDLGRVTVESEGDPVRLELHVFIELDRPSRFTGKMLGYPSTLSQYKSKNVQAITNTVRKAVGRAIDQETEVQFVYSAEQSEPGRTAAYKASFDIWFDNNGEIDSVWIRALPREE